MIFFSQAQKGLVFSKSSLKSQEYYMQDHEKIHIPGINYDIKSWTQNPLICFILCWKHLSFLVYQLEFI